MIHVATHLVLLFAACVEDGSTFTVVGEAPVAPPDRARLVVEVEDDRAAPDRPMPLPVRAIVTAERRQPPRRLRPGHLRRRPLLRRRRASPWTCPPAARGPPAQRAELRAAGAGRRGQGGAGDPARGPGCTAGSRPRSGAGTRGDNHVHAQHDATAAIRTDLAYTALQARANGLSYVTEADSGPVPGRRRAAEHADVPVPPRPGARGPARSSATSTRRASPGRSRRRSMPGSSTARCPPRGSPRRSTGRGGAVIHTHPLTPPHQMHWMGAAEILSDAVLGRPADALDLDGQASELLWFAVLNLGNRVAASSYTDCALGRRSTPSPGDRRVYCRAEELTYPAVVEAIRGGRTFATNGGPVFPFLTIDGKGPGETLEPGGDRPHAVRAEVHSLLPAEVGPALPAGRAGPRLRGGREDGRGRPGGRPAARGPASGPGTPCGSRTSGATGRSPARSTSSRRGRRRARSPRP